MPTPYNVCNGQAASGSSTLAVTVGSGTPAGRSTSAGDLVYVAAGDGAGLAINSVTDSQGNTYTKQADVTGGGNQRCTIWASLTTHALVSGTDTITITYAGTGGSKYLIARGCPGVVSATADKSAGITGTSTSPNSGPTGTLSQSAELAVGLIQDATAGGTPTGLSFGTGLTVGNLTEFEEITSSTAALAASGTITSAAWGACIATFKLGALATTAQTVTPAQKAVAANKFATAAQTISRVAQAAGGVVVSGQPYLIGKGGAASGTGLNVTAGSGGGQPPALGDTVIAAGGAAGTHATGVTDTGGNTYTLPPGASDDTSPGTRLYSCVSPASLITAGGSFTFSYGGGGGGKGGIVIGVPRGSRMDTPVAADGTSGAPSVTTGTMKQPNQWVIATCTYSSAGGSGFTWGTGWTVLCAPFQVASGAEWMTAACKQATGTAAVTASGTMASANWSIVAQPVTPLTGTAAQTVTPTQAAATAVTGGVRQATAAQTVTPAQAVTVADIATRTRTAVQQLTPVQAVTTLVTGPGQFPDGPLGWQAEMLLNSPQATGALGTPGLAGGTILHDTGSPTVSQITTTIENWSAIVYKVGSLKVFFPQGSFPTSSNYVTAICNMVASGYQIRLVLCYKPAVDGSDATALYASISAFQSQLAAAGAPAPVIALWNEAMGSGNLTPTSAGAAQYLQCVYNYQAHIRSTLGLKLMYLGVGYQYQWASAFFPGPPNSDPGGPIAAPKVDIVAVDLYCKDYFEFPGSSPVRTLQPWMNVANGNGGSHFACLPFAWTETGNSVGTPFPTQDELQSFYGPGGYAWNALLAWRQAGNPLDSFMWYQNNSGSGENAITAASDQRIPWLRNLAALVTGTSSSGGPLPWQDITGYMYAPVGQPAVTLTRGRPDQSSQVSSGTVSAKVDNRSGNFSAADPNGQWYGRIGKNTPLRVSVPSQGTSLRLENDSVSCASTPDAPALDITGDIDIRIDITPSSYVTGVLAAKWTPGAGQTQNSWVLQLNGDGTVTLFWSSTGANLFAAQSTVPLPYVGRIMIRAALAVATGTVTFWTAASMGAAQTQLGAPVSGTGGAATSVFSSTAALSVGSYATAGPGVNGNVREFRLFNGVGGTIAADAAFSEVPAGSTTWTGPAGLTWTLQGTAEISGRSFRGHFEMSSVPKATDQTLTDVWVPFQGGGLLRRLQQGNAPLYSPMRRALQSQSGTLACHALWPCEDLQGATAIGSAVGGPLMTVSGGTGDGTVTKTGPAFASDSTFACSSALPVANGSIWHGVVPAYASNGSAVVRFLLNQQDNGTGNMRLMRVITTGTCTEWSLYYGPSGSGQIGIAGYNSSGTVFDSGLFAFNIGSQQMWVSMELRPGTGTTVNWSLATLIPGAASGNGVSGTFHGTIGNVTDVYPNPQGLAVQTTFGQISVQSAWESLFALYQPLNAWAGETAGNRFYRLCTENGIAARIYGPPDVSAAMGYQAVDSLPNLLQSCETADMGLMGESRKSYSLVYRTLASMLNQAAAVTFDWAQGQLDYQGWQPPVADDLYLLNDWTVTRSSGGSGAAASGATYRATLNDGSPLSISPPQNGGAGDYASSESVNVQADTQLPDVAGWLVHRGTVAADRYPAIPIDMAARGISALHPAIVSAEIGDRADQVNTQAWLDVNAIRQLIAGADEEIGDFWYKIAWNSIPERPYETGIYDDLVYGRADTDGSTLQAAIGTTDTTFQVASTDTTKPLWTTAAADFPFDISVRPAGAPGKGERMTVTNITGSSSPQTFTVTRSVNGVVMSHAAGELAELFFTPVYAIA